MRITHLGILCTIALVVFCTSGAMAASETVKILPLGDSITKGSVATPQEAKYPTYRYWLWKDLTENGYDVDFVGSWAAPNFKDFTFDQDNEGHGGYSTDELLHGVPHDEWENGHLSQWIQGYDYDIVLLMAGTNDILRGVPTNESVTNLKKIITVVRQKNPRVTVFLATLPPTKGYRQGLITLNQKILGIVDEMDTPESRVILVEQFYGFDGASDTQPPGYVHPNTTGEKKLARNWYDALTTYLDGMTPTPIPTPTPLPTTIATPIPTMIPTLEPTPVETPLPTTIATPGPTQVVTQPTAVITVPSQAATGPGFGARRYGVGGARSADGFSRYEWSTGTHESPGSITPSVPRYGTETGSRAFVRWYRSERWASSAW